MVEVKDNPNYRTIDELLPRTIIELILTDYSLINKAENLKETQRKKLGLEKNVIEYFSISTASIITAVCEQEGIDVTPLSIKLDICNLDCDIQKLQRETSNGYLIIDEDRLSNYAKLLGLSLNDFIDRYNSDAMKTINEVARALNRLEKRGENNAYKEETKT